MYLSSTSSVESSSGLFASHLAKSDPAAQNRVTAVQPLHALIIDDNRDLARLFADILEVLGCTTEVAWAGQSGLNMAHERVPDIIFCDINMPGDKSGLDVAMAVRANKDFEHTRLIAITGFNDPDSIEVARAAGFDSIFGKPIKFAQLKEVVESHLHQTRI
jgi:CheY-like chemotaxis protein